MRALHILTAAAMAATLLVGSRPAAPSAPRESPELIWEQVIQNDRFEYEYFGAALGRGDGGGVWVLYGLMPKGSLAAPQGFRLTHLDGSGKSVGQFDLDASLKSVAADERYDGAPGIASLSANGLGLIVPAARGGASLVVLDNRTAQLLSEHKIHPESDLYVTKVVPSDEGSLLLGRVGGDGWLGKVGGSGKLVWERNLGTEGVAVLLDGAQSDDGGFLLLGSDKNGDASSTWVGKVTARGDLIVKNRVVGEAQRISSSDDGSAVVVGDRRGTDGREVWARGLTPSLTESWNTTIVSGVKGVFPFTVASVSGGWVVVGAGKDRLPSISRVSKGGQLLWTYTYRMNPALVPLMGRGEVLSTGQEIYVLFTLASLNDAREQRESVRVLKFAVR
jgi:hypothetical protein